MSGSADRTFRPRNRPPRGRRSGAGAALAAPFSASRAAGELDLPASRGCCAAAATPATAALQRRRRAREAAPCESARGRAGAAARGYRIYRGQSRTLEGGSLRARYRICWVPRRSFPGVGAPRLNYVFIQGCVVPRGALRPLGVGCIHSLRELGLAVGRGGLRQQGGGLRIFVGVGLRRRVYHISPGLLRPQKLARLCVRSGGVGSALPINAAI